MYIRKISVEISAPYAENLIRVFQIVKVSMRCFEKNADHGEAMMAVCSFLCASKEDEADHAVVFTEAFEELLARGTVKTFFETGVLSAEFSDNKLRLIFARRYGSMYLDLIHESRIWKSLTIDHLLMKAERRGIRFSAFVNARADTPILRDQVVQHLFRRACEMVERVQALEQELGSLGKGYEALVRAAEEEKRFFEELV